MLAGGYDLSDDVSDEVVILEEATAPAHNRVAGAELGVIVRACKCFNTVDNSEAASGDLHNNLDFSTVMVSAHVALPDRIC